MSKRDLIDLAVEYGMIQSTTDFYGMNEKQQDAILNQIRNVVTPELEATCKAGWERMGA
jgi:hypothetical protein